MKQLKMMLVILLTMIGANAFASNERPRPLKPIFKPMKQIHFTVVVQGTAPCPPGMNGGAGNCNTYTCYSVTYTIGGTISWHPTTMGNCPSGTGMISTASRSMDVPAEADEVIKEAICQYLTANPLPEYETQPCP